MIRDITIGQYFPGQSAIHRMDPRTKIILSILYIVMLFVADNMWGLLLGVLFGFAAYLISRGLAKSGSREPYWAGGTNEERDAGSDRYAKH